MYRAMKRPVFSAIKSMTQEEFTELQQVVEFNKADPSWHRLGCRMCDLKRRRHTVLAKLVAKPA
jgi:hypothetical protein